MTTKKLISFDLDCTLIDPTFTTFVWEIGIPRLYANKNDVSLSEAIPLRIPGSFLRFWKRSTPGIIGWSCAPSRCSHGVSKRP